MDKRTIIAIALSAAVIIIFQVFFFAPAEREASRKAEEARAQLERARQDSLAFAAAAASDTVSRGPGAEEVKLRDAATSVPGALTPGATGVDEGSAARASGPGDAGAPASGMPVALVGGMSSNFVEPSPPPPSEIVVETRLYKATFTSRGALLKSIKLKDFKAQTGSLVDLVRTSGETGPTPGAQPGTSGPGGNQPSAAAQSSAPPPVGEPGVGELSIVLTSDRGQIDLSRVEFAVAESLDAGTGRVRKLVFVATNPEGHSVTKTYAFEENSYAIGFDIEVRGASSQFYKVDCLVGWTNGLSLTDLNEKEEIRNLATVSLLGTEMLRDDLNSFKKTAFKEHSGNVKWTGVKSRYFIAALIPPEETVSKVYSFGNPDANVSGTQLVIPVSASGVTQTSLRLYAGPIDLWRLKELQVGLERVVNLGWSWIRPVSQLVLWFLVKCHSAIPNYGIVIIILSALTKVLFHPLTKSSMKSMREMQKLQPEIKKLREKYKGDAQKLNKEVMALYKKEKINPLGGCLPLLLQMPVFIALYSVLMNSIEMRRASFVWWIDDLSSPDTVAVIAGFAIHLLPLLMAATMFWQQKMTPTDPRQAAMTYFMPILMLVFFYGLPSGLVLYWTANNAMTIGQQYLMQRGEKKKAPETLPVEQKPTGKKGGRS